MENLENNVVNNEVKENVDVEAKEVKTFTQEELDKILNKKEKRDFKLLLIDFGRSFFIVFYLLDVKEIRFINYI